MTKKIMPPLLLFLFALLFPPIPVPLHAGAPVIDILLIDKRDKDNYEETAPPDYLIIGVLTDSACLFKLSSGTVVTAAGQFTNGMNTMTIPAAPLLKNDGAHSYRYTLDVKAGDNVFQKMITLEITVKSGSPVASGDNEVKTDTGKTRYYEISMSVEGRFIDSILKPVNPLQVLAGFGKNMPPPLEFDPIDRSKPLQYKAAINPLTLAFMAYKTIDKKIKKNKALKRKEMLEKTKTLAGTFWKKDEKGVKIPLEISITISAHDSF